MLHKPDIRDPQRLHHRVVLFVSGNDLGIARIVRAGGVSLQARTPAGRTIRIQPNQIAAVAPAGTFPSERFAESARTLMENIRKAAEEIDPDLLWAEAVETQGADGVSPATLAEAYFGSADFLHTGAVIRRMLDDPIRFEKRGVTFRARSAEAVERARQRAVRETERKKTEERAVTLFERILASPPGAVTESELRDVDPVLRRLEDYVLRGTASSVERVLTRLPAGRKHPRACAVDILDKSGRLPPDLDRWLLRHGAFPRFPRAVEEHAAKLPAWRPEAEPGRLDLTATLMVTIDDAETREVDDALSLTRTATSWQLGVHIADPSVWVRAGDPVDRAAAGRPMSLYLPTGVVSMLPERIGSDLASLSPDAERPALSCLIDLNDDFEVRQFHFAASRIRVDRRCTYDEVDAVLAGNASLNPDIDEMLRSLAAVAEAFRSRREAAGGVRIVRPEVRIRAREGTVTLELIDSDSPAHRLVSECMIASNVLAARFALRHDIPVIFRTQPAPEVGSHRIMERYDPVVFLNLVRGMQRTRLSTHPGPHGGLGVDLYIQMTSPIRRYSDLVMQRQFAAWFRDRNFPYDVHRLIEILGRAEKQERENRRLEQDARRYWTLEWLKQRPDQPHPAIVISTRRGVEVELQDCLARARLVDSGTVRTGDHLIVLTKEVNSERDLLVVRRITA